MKQQLLTMPATLQLSHGSSVMNILALLSRGIIVILLNKVCRELSYQFREAL